jgi:hypothetical protein
MASMPGYNSLYDTNPLPNPADGPPSTSAPPAPVGPSKQLLVDWLTPLPLDTPVPPNPGGSGGGSDTPPPFPDHAEVSIKPAEILFAEQEVINGAINQAAAFNALADAAEATATDPMWGLNEGANASQHHAPGSGSSTNTQGEYQPDGLPHYVYTDSALTTQQFVQSLVQNQRTALQYTANIMVVLGGYIELLQQTADAYAVADQFCVFPSKADVQKSAGS